MREESKTCLHCEHEFIVNRSNQKFCSGKCRSRFHNENNVQNQSIVKKTDKVLHTDYKILLGLLKERREIEVQNIQLYRKGFSFSSVTHLVDLEDGFNYKSGLYDLCYFKTKNNNYKIIRP